MFNHGLFASIVAAVAVLSSSLAEGAAEKTIYTFCHASVCPDGNTPSGGLVNVNGMLYGTTEYGGKGRDGGYGVIFAVDPKTGKEIVEHKFNKADGAAPLGGLVDVGGLLYGTTDGGGWEKGPISRRRGRQQHFAAVKYAARLSASVASSVRAIA
jgi:uncharacterized repeat protein (TIGR03803 family)